MELTRKMVTQNTGNKSTPVWLPLLLFFSCTDIYLISGVKLAYIFGIFAILSLLTTKIKLTKKDFILFAWYASYYLSIGNVLSWSDFFAVAIGQAVLIAIYLFFANIKSHFLIRKCNYYFQLSLYLLVVIGAVQLTLYYLFGSTWGISHLTHGVGLPRVSGLSLEPDWYGVICMMASIYMVFNIIKNKRVFSKGLDWLICLISIGMLLFCLTRAAWVGFAAAIAAFIFLKMRKNDCFAKRKLLSYGITAFIILAVTLALLSGTGSDITTKLLQRLDISQWMTNDGGAAGSRTSAIEIMLIYFAKHPLVGNGVGGMGYISTNTSLLASLGYNYEINTGRGNANLIANCLFETGIVGTLIFLVFIFVSLKDMYIDYKKSGDLAQLVFFLLTIALLVDFQFNNGIRMLYVWIILGLSSSLSRCRNTKGKIMTNQSNS